MKSWMLVRKPLRGYVMSNENELIEETATIIRAGILVAVGPVLELIYKDPHSWSTRPCATCRAASAIIGQPFGCDRYRKERGNDKS